MRRFLLWSGKNPWVVIVLMTLLSVIAIRGVFSLRIDTSTEGMILSGSPEHQYYKKSTEKFGTDNITIVYVRDEDLFTPEKIAALEDLAYSLEEVEGVVRMESLFTVTDFRNVDGFLEANPLIDWLPETGEEALEIKQNTLSNPLLIGNLVTKDGKGAAINLYVDENEADSDFNIRFSRAVDEIIAEKGEPFDTAFQLGLSYTRRLISENIISDQIKLVPLSIIVLLLVLTVTMRSTSGAALPLITAGTSVLWTAGFMGYAGIPINLLTVIVPSLIVVIGSTEDIHILTEYIEGVREGKERMPAINYMAEKVGTAILLTSMTTFIGFLSITLNKITMLEQFGVVASFGLLVNPLVTCMAAPVYLRFFGPSRPMIRRRDSTAVLDKWITAMGDWLLHAVRHHKKALLVLFLGGGALIGLFMTQVKVDNDLLGYFRESSGIRRRSQMMHVQLSGPQAFYLRITAGYEGAFKEPERLKALHDIQEFIDEREMFDQSISLADHIALIHREMRENGSFAVPDRPELIPQYLLFLHRDDISRLVNSDFSEANIVIRHNLSSSHRLSAALSGLDDYLEKNLGEHLKYRFTGQNILLNDAADTMAGAQAKSLSLLLVVIFLIMSTLFVNIKAGLLALVPNAFPIVVNFGIMGLAGVPLNTGTAMVAAIAIGIAVDDTVHLMSRYHKEMRRMQDQDAAMDVSIRAEIKPVVCTSVALALGFGVLAFSGFMPVVMFGYLSAMVMLLAMVGDLCITPILLSSTQLITLWEVVTLRLGKEVLTSSKLFEGLKAWQIKKIVLLGRMLDKTSGEYAVREGERGNSMFIVIQGELSVFGRKAETEEEIYYTRLGPGDVFGEVCLVEPGPRTANVRAESDAKLIEIDWNGLKRIRRVYPWLSSKLFLNLSRIVGKRLAEADQLICKLR
jgi:hypothetical protein